VHATEAQDYDDMINWILHIFMEWCLVKHYDNFAFTSETREESYFLRVLVMPKNEKIIMLIMARVPKFTYEPEGTIP
jgi:hypothetical protein